MAPKLYMTIASPPIRSTLMLAKPLNIELEPVEVDLTSGGNLQPEYLKLNPQHTVPTLVDNGHAIWDSHAVNLYLIEKYGKETPLYSKDLYKKAAINQRLFFDTEHLYPSLRNITALLFTRQRQHITKEAHAKVEEVYTFLETFLERAKYVAGNEVTLADITFIANVTSLNELIPINPKHTYLHNWIVSMKTLPYYSENIPGLQTFTGIVHIIMGKSVTAREVLER